MKKKRKVQYLFCLFLAVMLACILTPAVRAAEDVKLTTGQTVYVPIYSHIYSGLKGRPFDLAATLSVRNTDPKNSITITSVEYYDTDGNLIKEYLDAPIQLKALASTRYIILEGDKTGGSGANFIVKWKSTAAVNPPIIEGVMIGTSSGQGISFISDGQVIKDD
jgi:hypothetical protein